MGEDQITVPAERSDWDGCDCFWHRRVFVHLSAGPGSDVRIPLPYERRTWNCHTRPNRHWRIQLLTDVGRIWVYRAITLGVPESRQFHSYMSDGSSLQRSPGNARIGNELPDGHDPTLIFDMPRGVGHLVVWSEAWSYNGDPTMWDDDQTTPMPNRPGWVSHG